MPINFRALLLHWERKRARDRKAGEGEGFTRPKSTCLLLKRKYLEDKNWWEGNQAYSMAGTLRRQEELSFP
jgi:hypothetical protein